MVEHAKCGSPGGVESPLDKQSGSSIVQIRESGSSRKRQGTLVWCLALCLNGSGLCTGKSVKCHLPESDPNGHDVKVLFDLSQVHDKATAKNLDVAVNCSYPAFLYWGGKWDSYQRDALEGEARPLLTAPTERLDLRENFVICTHIKAVSERIPVRPLPMNK